MSDSLTLQVEDLSLSNVGDGAAMQLFAAELERVADMFNQHADAIDDGGIYTTRDGCIEAEITIKVRVIHNIENRVTEVGVGCSSKLPSRKGVRRPVMLRPEGFIMEPEGVQPLLMHTKKPNQN